MEKELSLCEKGVQNGHDPAILYAWEHVPISLCPLSIGLCFLLPPRFKLLSIKPETARHFRLSPSPSWWAMSGREAETRLTKASLALSHSCPRSLPLSLLPPTAVFSRRAYFSRRPFPIPIPLGSNTSKYNQPQREL